ncbi:uncharacterized protein [Physcomitrium patens]|uniref:uncharacterized protein isoform X1 n=1 Tax=Physcomitrium patens TaxID=3218 RepID=UPI000D15168B|nr:uncharacterized protein LOC112273315 isoform X1 [Physcomitrium patens]XP_024357715.1 uncharacterized protein LOC112273315 isoform X1 [Physcomitrium patens]XP_024357716.1 uncharacterized protein LOC112273315 isoform X1 [Physcomitrium patens]XP_024357717.1 uncharacterized protein LOC112273315 isoform X1 [Physcomitrium patens]XP_024357718.1 uncharacterized protein LOC112273315 isoform X1 [Physcomitrium patens]XP_024357719.1 uncharacterized protein LOC112273315 isoform X1 [Physcomitrium patens]|eukprot:XP_024357714.1 uncharacterized protein LOC112273315 isoform X1 [Physcomitrella patens]
MEFLQSPLQPRHPWKTTNSSYGNFYVPVHREVRKPPEPVAHDACNKKADALGKELCEIKSKVECLTQRCGNKLYSEWPPKTGEKEHTCFILPPTGGVNRSMFSPKIGLCACPENPGPPNANPYETECRTEYNGAKKNDAQFLEEHIKTEHPRLVKHLHPCLPFSAPCAVGDHFPSPIDDYKQSGSKSGSRSSERHRQCKMIGLYKRSNKEYHLNYGHEQGNSNRKHHNDNNFQIRIMGNNNNYNPSRPINKPHLKPRPAYDQCYNYYRYYGYAGKGAKTSKGWQPKLKF